MTFLHIIASWFAAGALLCWVFARTCSKAGWFSTRRADMYKERP